MDNVPLNWARDVVRISLKGGPDFEDPGKDPRFRKLVEAVLSSRKIVRTYNYVLLAILSVFAILHLSERKALQKRARKIRRESGSVRKDGDVGDEAWSSSSSTIEGTATPPNAQAKRAEQQYETEPLLRNRKRRRISGVHRIYWHCKAWLQHQPPPIPFINKSLPPNNITLLILSFFALNIFYNIYRMPLSLPYLFVFADRCGLIFVSNLPLLYFLSAKTQPLKLLTGMSYESLNIFHRRVGELLCFEALVHCLGMMAVWYTMLSRIGFSLYKFLFNPLVLFGLAAFVAYEVLFLTSLRSLRQWCYEVFLALHVFLQLAGLGFVWLHYRTGRVYVAVSVGVFLVDRLVFRCWVKRSRHLATCAVLPDGETLLLSANWDVNTPPARRWFPFSLLLQSMARGWRPTDHVFLTVPDISKFEAHPFTIFSAAPVSSSTSPSSTTTPSHAWLTLLIRAQSGFTRTLLSHATQNPTIPIHLDGPYGSSHALAILSSRPNAIIVAGGSGIAVAYPLLWALLSPASPSSINYHASATEFIPGRQKIRLLWIVRAREHWEWLPVDKRLELVDWGLGLRLEVPTQARGRPDVGMIVRGWVEDGWVGDGMDAVGGLGEEGELGGTGVVVSGPDGLVRDMRNACAGCVGRGMSVDVCVEKFGW
jgi:hypothetical protein